MRWLPLLLVVALTACGPASSSDPASPGVATDPSGTVDPALLEPLERLGPCPSTPAGSAPQTPGLALPDGAVVTRVDQVGELVNVQGWVSLTPVEVRVSYLQRDDVTVLTHEDEIHEAEVLATVGEHRMFVKAQAVCRRGSVFVAVVAPEVAASAVPVPTGGGSPDG